MDYTFFLANVGVSVGLFGGAARRLPWPALPCPGHVCCSGCSSLHTYSTASVGHSPVALPSGPLAGSSTKSNSKILIIFSSTFSPAFSFPPRLSHVFLLFLMYYVNIFILLSFSFALCSILVKAAFACRRRRAVRPGCLRGPPCETLDAPRPRPLAAASIWCSCGNRSE